MITAAATAGAALNCIRIPLRVRNGNAAQQQSLHNALIIDFPPNRSKWLFTNNLDLGHAPPFGRALKLDHNPDRGVDMVDDIGPPER